MHLLIRFVRRIGNVLRPRRANADLGDELRFHLEMEAATLEQQGLAPDSARAEAHRRFGGVDRYAEACRDERDGRRFETVVQDARYALRVARRVPGFSAIVVLTLAFAIGANTAIFSVVRAVLLRPLPFPRGGELVALYSQNPDRSLPRFSVSWADYLDWRRQATSFAGIAAFRSSTMTLAGAGEPERVPGLVATRNLLDVVGMAPAIGRGFGAEDERGESSQTVILGHGFWQRRFAGDTGIIGRSISLAGRSRTVIGVLPREFSLDGRPVDAITVLAPSTIPNVDSHAQHMLESVARLKPGVTIAQARMDLGAVAARLAAAHPEIAGWSANVFSWRDELVRTTRRPLLVLLAAAALVLAIGCINVANLLVTRGAARGREMALRQALGASRSRLVGQMLVESAALALTGGLLGVALADVGTKGMLSLVPAGVVPRIEDVRVDGVVLGFALALSVITAVVVGLWPALRVTGPRLAAALRSGGRGSGQIGHSPRIRRALVVTEVSLALVLLVCSALVIQSLRNIVNVDLGFRVDRIVTMRLTLNPASYSDSAQSVFYRDLLDRLAARPGIEAAAAANTPPMSGGGIVTNIRLVGRAAPATQQLMGAATAVTPGYFRTMGMRLTKGRDVSWDDAAPTLVLNETAARTYWPGEDVIGKRISFGRTDNSGLEIVGVVADARARGPMVDPAPMIYMAYSGASNIARTMSLVVRGAGDPGAVVAATRSVLQEMDRTLPVFNAQTVREVVEQFIAQPRLNTTLLGVFAGMALLLAGIGIYGVVSHSVAQRTQELGVRIALGAQRGDVVRLVLGEGAALAVAGVLLGLAAAFAATPLIRSWLFGIGANDPLTLTAVALTLVTIALAASYIPARRATRVDPVLAMRGE